MDRRALLGGLCACAAFATQAAHATDAYGSIYFAGYAFLPRDDEVSARLRHTEPIVANSSGLNSSLAATAQRFEAPNFPRLVVSELGQLAGTDQALVLALAFDREHAWIERHGDLYKLSVEIWAQALVFDFVSNQVIAAYPLAARFNDARAERFVEADTQAAIRRMAVGQGEEGIPACFWRTLANVALPGPASRTLRVTKVEFSEQATEHLGRFDVSPTDLAPQIAADLAAFITMNKHVPVLPHSSGAALGSTMAARMADGAVYQLAIPQPDYEVLVRVDGFRRVVAEQTELRAAYVYGAFATIEITEPLTQRVLFSARMRRGAQRTVLLDAELNEWPSYYEALIGLFSDVTSQMTRDARQWEQTHLVSDRTPLNSLRTLNDLLEQCR
jgi:hypothetical protein